MDTRLGRVNYNSADRPGGGPVRRDTLRLSPGNNEESSGLN